MKTLFALCSLTIAFSSFAIETPRVLDARIENDKMIVEFEYEKSVRPFVLLPLIQFPVKHTWTKIITCPSNEQGDTTAKIDVTVKVKDEKLEVLPTPGSQKALTFNLSTMCKGTKIDKIVINEAELSLGQNT